MPIPVVCACGKQYKLKDEFAGRRAKCPACGATIVVPGEGVDQIEELTQQLSQQPPPPRSTASPGGISTRRSASKLPVVLGVVAVLALVGGGVLIGSRFSSNAPGLPTSIFGSPYSVDYKVGYQNEARDSLAMEVTVKGPAAQLAVILTNPEGETGVDQTSKEGMITNRHVFQLGMGDPQAGTWVLVAKTFDPEKIVWQQDINFSPPYLTVEDVKIDYGGNGGILITLHKTGNLPILFSRVLLTGPGGQSIGSLVWGGRAVVEEEHTVPVSFTGFLPKTQYMIERDSRRGAIPYVGAHFEPGDRYPFKGTLFYDKGHKSLDFEKEYVASQQK